MPVGEGAKLTTTITLGSEDLVFGRMTKTGDESAHPTSMRGHMTPTFLSH